MSQALIEVKKAWATTIRRIAAVKLRYSQFGEVGRKTLCAASLHCSKSAGTADLLAVLKDVLEEVVGKKASFIIGLDSNVPGKDAGEFQDKLREMGMDFGDRPEAQQVTVAKTRTEFQTQVKKAGDTDVSATVFFFFSRFRKALGEKGGRLGSVVWVGVVGPKFW